MEGREGREVMGGGKQVCVCVCVCGGSDGWRMGALVGAETVLLGVLHMCVLAWIELHPCRRYRWRHLPTFSVDTARLQVHTCT